MTDYYKKYLKYKKKYLNKKKIYIGGMQPQRPPKRPATAPAPTDTAVAVTIPRQVLKVKRSTTPGSAPRAPPVYFPVYFNTTERDLNMWQASPFSRINQLIINFGPKIEREKKKTMTTKPALHAPLNSKKEALIAHDIIHNKELLTLVFYQHVIQQFDLKEKIEFLLSMRFGFLNLKYCQTVANNRDLVEKVEALVYTILDLQDKVEIAIIAAYLSNITIQLTPDGNSFFLYKANGEQIEKKDYFDDPDFQKALNIVIDARKKDSPQNQTAPQDGKIILQDSKKSQQFRICSERYQLISLMQTFEQQIIGLIELILEENSILKKMIIDFVKPKNILAFGMNYDKLNRVPGLGKFLEEKYFFLNSTQTLRCVTETVVQYPISARGGGKPVQKANDTTVFMSEYNQKKKQPKIGGSATGASSGSPSFPPLKNVVLRANFTRFCKLFELKDLRADLYHDFGWDILEGMEAYLTDITSKPIPFNSNMESELMKTIIGDLDANGQLIFGFYDKAADGEVKFLNLGEPTLDKMIEDFQTSEREIFTDANTKKYPHCLNEENLCRHLFTLTCSNSIDSAGLGTGTDFTCKAHLLQYLSYYFDERDKQGNWKIPPAPGTTESVYIIDKFYKLLLELLECIIQKPIEEHKKEGKPHPRKYDLLLCAVELLKNIEFVHIDEQSSRAKLYVKVLGMGDDDAVEWFVSQSACAKEVNSVFGSKIVTERNSEIKGPAKLIKLIKKIKPTGVSGNEIKYCRIYAILFLKFIGDLSHILLLYILHEMGHKTAVVKTNDRCLFYNSTRVINKYNDLYRTHPIAVDVPDSSTGGANTTTENDMEEDVKTEDVETKERNNFKNGILLSTGNGKPPESVRDNCQTDILARAAYGSSSSNFNYRCAILFQKVSEFDRAVNYLNSIFKLILDYKSDRPDYIDGYFTHPKPSDKMPQLLKKMEETYKAGAKTKLRVLYEDSIKRQKNKRVAATLHSLQTRLNIMRDRRDVNTFHVFNKKLHDVLPDWIDTKKLIQIFTETHVPETNWVKPDVRTLMWSPNKFSEYYPSFPKYFLGLIVTQIVNSKKAESGGGMVIDYVTKSYNTMNGLNYDTLHNLKELIDFLKAVFFWAQTYFGQAAAHRTPWLNYLFVKIQDYLNEFKKHAPRRLDLKLPNPDTIAAYATDFVVPDFGDDAKIAGEEAKSSSPPGRELYDAAVAIATFATSTSAGAIDASAIAAAVETDAEMVDAADVDVDVAAATAAARTAASIAYDAAVSVQMQPIVAAATAAGAGAVAAAKKIAAAADESYTASDRAIAAAIEVAVDAHNDEINSGVNPLPEVVIAAAAAAAAAAVDVDFDPAVDITTRFNDIYEANYNGKNAYDAAATAAAAADAIVSTTAAKTKAIAVTAGAAAAAATAAFAAAVETDAEMDDAAPETDESEKVDSAAVSIDLSLDAVDAVANATDKIVDKFTHSLINDFIERLCLKSWDRSDPLPFYNDGNIFTSAEFTQLTGLAPEIFENLKSEIRQSIIQIQELVDLCLAKIPALPPHKQPVQMAWTLEDDTFIKHYSENIDKEKDDKLNEFDSKIDIVWDNIVSTFKFEKAPDGSDLPVEWP